MYIKNTKMTELEIFQTQPPQPPQPKESRSLGNFDYIEIELEKKMIENGYKAISILELWGYMKKPNESYMISRDPELTLIHEKMKELGYYGHSGCSFGWTMRQLQYIAVYGEENYKKNYLKRKE